MSSERATNLIDNLSQSVQRVKLCNAIKFQQKKNIRFSDDFISSPIFVIDDILAKCKNEQQLQNCCDFGICQKCHTPNLKMSF